MNDINIIREELAWYATRLHPTSLIRSLVNTTADIIIYRSNLGEAVYNQNDLIHLLDIIISAIHTKQRFRQLDCLLVIKRIIKRIPPDFQFSSDITDRLFFLYTHYIFRTNENIQWAASVMLKNRVLSDNQIQWLIDNYKESEHILNRLLRYPKKSNLIVQWAQRLASEASFPEERKSELFGWLIDASMPLIIANEDPRIQVWAIYYSKSSDDIKQKLLCEVSSPSNLWEVAEIAIRCKYPKVIDYLLDNANQFQLDYSIDN